jgi:hypothetical protein
VLTRDLDRSICPRTSSTTSRLRTLNLDYNECFVKYRKATTKLDNDKGTIIAILRLLEVFPRLGYLGNDFSQALDDSSGAGRRSIGGFLPLSALQHQMDMNRCGAHLLRVEPQESSSLSSSSLPLSVWSLVLAKANDMRDGPAFGAREALS